MRVSAIVITKNSARTIERCLNSLSFAHERIIVDSGSDDNTLDIAAKFNTKIYHNKWPGYGAQKNFGAAKASGDWLLFIDSDEEVTTELQSAIKKTIKTPRFDYYWIRIVTIFLQQPLRHLYGHNPRLIRNASGSWTNSPVHEQIQDKSGITISLGDNMSGLIKQPLLHHSHKTIKSYLKRMHRYTTLDAKQMKQTNRHRSGRPVKPTYFLPFGLSLRQFIKLYFYRRGLLDGYAGLIWCVLSAYYEFDLAKKYLK